MNAIQKFIEAEHKYLDLNEIDYKEYEQMVEPLRDVECVVRCKDCEHGFITENGKVKCDELCTDDDGYPMVLYHNADWFCANGKRRDMK